MDGDEFVEVGERGPASVRARGVWRRERADAGRLIRSPGLTLKAVAATRPVGAVGGLAVRDQAGRLNAAGRLDDAAPIPTTLLFDPDRVERTSWTWLPRPAVVRAAAPERSGRRKSSKPGKLRDNQAAVDGLAGAETSSGVFPEAAGIREVLMDLPVQGELGQALEGVCRVAAQPGEQPPVLDDTGQPA